MFNYRYLYCGETNVSHANVLSLYLMARKYLVVGLEATCLCHLTTYINDREVFLMLDFLVRYDDPQPVQMCVGYINRRITYLGHTQHFLSISKPALMEVVASDGLDASEDDLYHMCVNWARHQITEDGDEVSDERIRLYLEGVLSLIRFPTMHTLTFAKQVDTEEVLTTQDKCAIYRYMITNQITGGGDRKGVDFPTTPRCPTRQTPLRILDPADPETAWVEANKLQVINFKLVQDTYISGFGIYDWINNDKDKDQIIAVRIDLRHAKKSSFGEVTGTNLLKERDLQFINVPRRGQVLYPVYFKKAIPMKGGVWYSLRATIRYKPNGECRKTLQPCSGGGIGENNIEANNTSYCVKYFPILNHNNTSVPCDLIAQLIFQDICHDKNRIIDNNL